MMRYKFEEELEKLNEEMIEMGSLCENAIAMSARALLNGDAPLAEDVMDLQTRIDQEERNIEDLCLKLLLQQQPVATDLRVISSALKMVTDMERIGDQAADIAEIIAGTQLTLPEETLPIHSMAVETIRMVTESIDAFVQKDLSIAKTVIEYDDVVDNYFSKIKATLADQLISEKKDIEHMLDILMIAKYFERIGDHAVNIAKWVIFSIEGKREEDD